MQHKGIWGLFVQCQDLLSEKNRKKFRFVIFVQAVLGLMDLVGVALIGAVGALSIRGIQSKEAGTRVSKLLNFLQIENSSIKTQIAILGAIAVIFLIGKTIISVYLSRRILFFLGNQGAIFSTDLVMKVFSQKILGIQQRTSDQFQYSTGFGVWSISLGILGVGSNMIADATLLVIISLGVFLIDPFIALVTFCLFGTVGLGLNMALRKKAREVGKGLANLQILSTRQLNELLLTYRENFVRNRRFYYADKLSKTRAEYSHSFAEQTFLPSISKYVIEVSLILGGVAISSLQFGFRDASRAVAALTLFIAAGSRIAPALLRLQQGYIQMHSSLGSAEPTLDLIEQTKNISKLSVTNNTVPISHEGFNPKINIENMEFSFPDSGKNLFQDLNLEILPGEFIAIVGPSGSGKSTLIDIILGIHNPKFGRVDVSDLPPEEAIAKWPGAIAYLPQSVGLIDGTIQDNILLGFPLEPENLLKAVEAVEAVGLNSFFANLEFGLETNVGERGARLSGGQRQKVGIARALLTNPSLLILDEATSALDSQSEAEVSQAINLLKGERTVIVVAHRLSTIRHADRVLYIDKGSILADGTFEKVRQLIPNFDTQAGLMGF